MSHLLLLTLLLACCASTAVVEDMILNNGDFETLPPGGFMSGHGGLGKVTPAIVNVGQKQGVMMLIVQQGKHAVRLGNESGIHQTVEGEKVATYSVTFSAARTCAQLEQLNVSSGSTASATVNLQTLYSVEGVRPCFPVEQNGQEMREEMLERAV